MEDFLGQVVALDMASTYIIIGRVERMDENSLMLHEADVHDLRESGSTRDYYLSQVQANGVRVNRKQVFVRMAEVVGITRLDDCVD